VATPVVVPVVVDDGGFIVIVVVSGFDLVAVIFIFIVVAVIFIFIVVAVVVVVIGFVTIIVYGDDAIGLPFASITNVNVPASVNTNEKA
jgi:hypothetical protein